MGRECTWPLHSSGAGGATQAQGDWDDLQLHLLCGEDQHWAAWHSPAESQDLLLLWQSRMVPTHVNKK